MGAPEAERYHDAQIQPFADTTADLVSAHDDHLRRRGRRASRAPPCARACPSSISFTVETDGRLPSGDDDRGRHPPGRRRHRSRARLLHAQLRAPQHFSGALQAGRRWPMRLRGIRANASRHSHAELDDATTLDDGDPVELAVEYRRAGRWAPPVHHPGWLLRHRSPPRRGHRRGVRGPVRAGPRGAQRPEISRRGARGAGVSGRWPRSARDQPVPGRRRRACRGRCSPGAPE